MKQIGMCENDYQAVLISNVTVLNGEITEGALNVAIAKELLNHRKKQKELEFDSSEHSAYVINYHSLAEFTFNKFTTIADAVRDALGNVNSRVVSRGKDIKYDRIDDDFAYYIKDNSSKINIVSIKNKDK